MSLNGLTPTNQLIDGLSEPDQIHLLARCELIQLSMGATFSESHKHGKHVCFPLNCLFSMATQVDEERDLGVRLIGREGLLGVGTMLGVAGLPLHVMVQGAGSALLISAGDLRAELARSSTLRDRLNAYLYVLLIQLASSGVCFQHSIEGRLARWLLMSGDGAHTDNFHVTHEFLAYMLGVRRAGVTEAAQALRSRGLISYHHGHIHILDRTDLEASACACYRFDKDIYEQVMGAA